MTEKKTDSAGYYDTFNAETAKSPINDRIIGLYKKILKNGFTSDSVNLELGCGPGKLTYLLSRKIRDGIIEAVDISPKSIEIALSKVKHPNIFFTASDSLNYQPRNPSFDNIFLFDVIEHIPDNDHPALFARIAQWMKEDSSLLINIPNPDYIVFARKYRPESLQEIDQAITLDKLSKLIMDAGLEITFFETYSIWAEDDYQFIKVKKQKPFIEHLRSNKRNIIQKAIVRLIREYRKLKYPF